MDSAQISCIAVDDEPSALRILEAFSKKVPQLDMLKTFRNPLEALSFLNFNKVDLIFLDINMPDISGIDFIKSLSNPPAIILTTAYSNFAVESYNYEVLDYLLKPIPFPRFLKAVNKLFERSITHKVVDTIEDQIIVLKDSGTTYYVDPREITHLEAMGNYVKVFTETQTIIIKSSLQNFIDENPIKYLIRVHKSYAVNMVKVKKMKYATIFINNIELPIGRKYRTAIHNVLGHNK